ncbi:MAG TPA: type II toxin-antitoxin system VapC family toxin [Streptosporangiaceae bacterium]|nr:type II toxin-antitoxin system VapC family toxin [Streptosporangiaceae bacterium]
MIIVDTNVVSELMKPSPSARVLDWLGEQPGRELCTSAITVAEVLYGIERLPPGRRREDLRTAATGVFQAFAEQVLAFDNDAAGEYALLVSHLERLGVPADGFDAQIAAICRVRGATLATRNVSDFRETGISIINPWDERG